MFMVKISDLMREWAEKGGFETQDTFPLKPGDLIFYNGHFVTRDGVVLSVEPEYEDCLVIKWETSVLGYPDRQRFDESEIADPNTGFYLRVTNEDYSGA